MSNDKLNIAKTIKVGFNKRSDTYTGMLAYVIYYDEKGVLRKQNSWESWRDKSIDPQEFENEPTSGFVLNKKVGDYKYDWNHRMAAVRVYDPRGFEFEISVENLLYILQECTSTKGKGLEGEFVYAWDRSDLVLLPTSSVEYQQSRIFTDHKSSKVSKKDMVAGCIYLTKDMENVLYLGKEDYYVFKYDYERGRTIRKHINTGKKHIFVYVDGDKRGTFWTQTGFTKIATRLSETISPSFAEEFEKYKHSFFGSPVVKITMEEVTPEFSYNTYNCVTYAKIKTYYKTFVKHNNEYYTYYQRQSTSGIIKLLIYEKLEIKDNFDVTETICAEKEISIPIEQLVLYKIVYHNEHGNTLEKTY